MRKCLCTERKVGVISLVWYDFHTHESSENKCMLTGRVGVLSGLRTHTCVVRNCLRFYDSLVLSQVQRDVTQQPAFREPSNLSEIGDTDDIQI